MSYGVVWCGVKWCHSSVATLESLVRSCSERQIHIFFSFQTVLYCLHIPAGAVGNNGNTKCQGFDNNKLNTHHFEDQSDQRLWHDQKL